MARTGLGGNGQDSGHKKHRKGAKEMERRGAPIIMHLPGMVVLKCLKRALRGLYDPQALIKVFPLI